MTGTQKVTKQPRTGAARGLLPSAFVSSLALMVGCEQNALVVRERQAGGVPTPSAVARAATGPAVAVLTVKEDEAGIVRLPLPASATSPTVSTSTPKGTETTHSADAAARKANLAEAPAGTPVEVQVRGVAGGILSEFGCGQKECLARFTPAADFSGQASFEFRYLVAGRVVGTWTKASIDVEAVDDLPGISGACQTKALSGASYACELSASNPDGGALVWTLDSQGAGACAWLTLETKNSNPSRASLTGTPPRGVGTCEIRASLKDSIGDNAIAYRATVAWEAAATPSIELRITNKTVGEDGLLTLSDADVQAANEGDGTAYRLDDANTTVPKCSAVGSVQITNTASGALTFAPGANWNGLCNVRVVASNGASETASEFAVNVTPADDVPIVSQTCAASASEDAAYTCSFTASNPDGGTLVWSLAPSNTCSFVSLSGTGPSGSATGTPGNSHVGTCNLVARVVDGVGGNVVDSPIGLTVANAAPLLVIADQAVAEDSSLNLLDATVQASDEGQGAGALYSLDHAGTTGTKCADRGAVSLVNPVNGALSFVPNANWNGACNIRVAFNDGNVSVANQFAVTVTPVDDVPVVSQSCPTTTIEGLGYSCSYSASNPDGGTLT